MRLTAAGLVCNPLSMEPTSASQLIRTRRRTLGWSARRTAAAAGVSASVISQLERPWAGRYANGPTVGVLARVGAVIGLPDVVLAAASDVLLISPLPARDRGEDQRLPFPEEETPCRVPE